MKPTLDSITEAFRSAQSLNATTQTAMLQLTGASVAHVCTSPNKVRAKLDVARRNLVTLRRTQTAALRHIDDAIKSLT